MGYTTVDADAEILDDRVQNQLEQRTELHLLLYRCMSLFNSYRGNQFKVERL